MQIMVEKMLKNRWLEIVLRWSLGVVFVYASIHKIVYPADFAKIIYGYKLFPAELINLMAITLPFIELVCGLSLIAGLWPGSAAIIINVLLFSFIVAITINLVRGHEFDCGCFSVIEQGAKSSAIGLLVRDIIWFLFGVFTIQFKEKRLFSLTG